MPAKVEYAVYKNDELLFIGTPKEIANFFNVKIATVHFWVSPANFRRIENRKTVSGGKYAIKIEKEEENE